MKSGASAMNCCFAQRYSVENVRYSASVHVFNGVKRTERIPLLPFSNYRLLIEPQLIHKPDVGGNKYEKLPNVFRALGT